MEQRQPLPLQPPAPATVVGVRAQHSVRPQRPPGSQHAALSLQAPEQAFRGQEPQAPSARRGLNVLGGGPSPPRPSRMPTTLTVRHQLPHLQLRFQVVLRAKATQEAPGCGPGRGYLSEAKTRHLQRLPGVQGQALSTGVWTSPQPCGKVTVKTAGRPPPPVVPVSPPAAAQQSTVWLPPLPPHSAAPPHMRLL